MVRLFRQSEITMYVGRLSKDKLKKETVSDILILMAINDDINQSLREVAIRLGLMTNKSFAFIYNYLNERLSNDLLYYSENTYVNGYRFYKWTPSDHEPNYTNFIITAYNKGLTEEDVYNI